jgi:hypothetical protein
MLTKQLVHEPCDVGALERLVLHHVAPVAGGIADGEEDRLVLLPGAGESFLSPGVPVDRVVGVLEEVRARLAGQAVRHAGILAAAGNRRNASSWVD